MSRGVVDRIREIEGYAREVMGKVVAELRIAHDFKHIDRVRGWALQIARDEAFPDLELVEAAALLHDIGLSSVDVEHRGAHGQVGAEMAARFLSEHGLYREEEVALVAEAIRRHNTPSGGGPLGEILRDADKLDLLGAVGLMRAFTSKYAKPDYDPEDVKGDTWDLSMEGFEARITGGQGIGATIADQVNFQISLYGNLHTATARRIGEHLVEVMKAYLVQLDSEIGAAQRRGGSDYD